MTYIIAIRLHYHCTLLLELLGHFGVSAFSALERSVDEEN
jgi:hypothetical protein